jgi:hypothetical protein
MSGWEEIAGLLMTATICATVSMVAMLLAAHFAREAYVLKHRYANLLAKYVRLKAEAPKATNPLGMPGWVNS